MLPGCLTPCLLSPWSGWMQHRLHSPFPAATRKPTPKCQQQRCCLWLWRPRAARCIQCCRQEVALKKTTTKKPHNPTKKPPKTKTPKNNKIILRADFFLREVMHSEPANITVPALPEHLNTQRDLKKPKTLLHSIYILS